MCMASMRKFTCLLGSSVVAFRARAREIIAFVCHLCGESLIQSIAIEAIVSSPDHSRACVRVHVHVYVCSVCKLEPGDEVIIIIL